MQPLRAILAVLFAALAIRAAHDGDHLSTACWSTAAVLYVVSFSHAEARP